MVYKTIRVVKNCAFPVWPAIVGSNDLPPPQMRKVREVFLTVGLIADVPIFVENTFQKCMSY